MGLPFRADAKPLTDGPDVEFIHTSSDLRIYYAGISLFFMLLYVESADAAAFYCLTW